MSHSFYMTQQSTFFPSIILIISAGRHYLWSNTLCSFPHIPITFNHKSLRTDQHCSQIQSTVFPQCHRPSVTPTFMKIPDKHTHTHTQTCLYFNSPVFRKQEGEQKFWGCSGHYSVLISSQVLHSAIFIPYHHSKIIQVLQHSKISNNVSARSCSLRYDIPTVPLKYLIRAKIFPVNDYVTVAIINGSYMFQLQSSHHQAAYVRSIK